MDDYYMSQAGSGMSAFSGVRYQKGDGFFGRLISGTVMPMIKKVLPFLGKTAMSSGVNVLNDWSQGEKLGESFRKRMTEAGQTVTDTAMAKVKQITGSGKRKRGKSVCRTQKRKKQHVVKRRKSRKTKRPKRKGRKAADFL